MKLYLASASPRRRELMKLLPYEFEVHIPDFDERAYEAKIRTQHIAESSSLIQEDLAPEMMNRVGVHREYGSCGEYRLKPEELTLEIARGKALCAYRELRTIHPEEDFIVLSADTIVLLEGEVLGKGENREKSLAMLKKLNGKTHEVITAAWLIGRRADAATGNFLESTPENSICHEKAERRKDKACDSLIEKFPEMQQRDGEKIESHLLEKSKVTFGENDEEWLERYVDAERPFDKAGAYGIQDGGALFVEKIEGSYHNVMGLPVRKVFLLLNKMLHRAKERTKGEISQTKGEIPQSKSERSSRKVK